MREEVQREVAQFVDLHDRADVADVATVVGSGKDGDHLVLVMHDVSLRVNKRRDVRSSPTRVLEPSVSASCQLETVRYIHTEYLADSTTGRIPPALLGRIRPQNVAEESFVRSQGISARKRGI